MYTGGAMQSVAERKTTTIQVKKDVHQAVKVAAKEDYTTVSLWVEEVVRKALEKRKKRPAD